MSTRESSSRLFDVAAELKHETPLAYLLSDGVTEAWVPKSRVEDNGDGTWTMPESLATEKGFA